MNKFEKLKKEILNCNICANNFGFDPHPIVFGKYNSKIMQISQAPSKNVHITLKPFNDHSGKKLINEWYCINEETFYNPNNFYITAMAHCYPGKSKSGGDRLPPKICATTWLMKEIEIIKNDLYIIIGSKSARFLFPDREYTSLIFETTFLNGKPAIVLPHPSPLNIKWFNDNPLFLKKRIFEIRETIHKVLGQNLSNKTPCNTQYKKLGRKY